MVNIVRSSQVILPLLPTARHCGWVSWNCIIVHNFPIVLVYDKIDVDKNYFSQIKTEISKSILQNI